jgi:integrase
VKPKPSGKPDAEEKWPRRVRLGRVSITVYRRRRSDGSLGYEVSSYATGKRRLESFPTAEGALERAANLARQMNNGESAAAELSARQAAEYFSSVEVLHPHGVSLLAAASAVADALKRVSGLPELQAAVQQYARRSQTVVRKPVADVVAELLQVKESRKASRRYLDDLESRLGRFSRDCRKSATDVSTSDIQGWLDSLNLSPQSYTNYRRTLNLLFEFALARSYADENPVAKTETLKVKGGTVEVYTPEEFQRLLEAAPAEFRACLALGGLAGLRSAEIERLRWEDIDLRQRHIVVGAERAKTAARRVIPMGEALVAWLGLTRPGSGLVWSGTRIGFYQQQKLTANRSRVGWKANGLRHSYASYRFAECADAGRVAGELGNTAAIVHRHYRELVSAEAARRWFGVLPPTRLGNDPIQPSLHAGAVHPRKSSPSRIPAAPPDPS